MPREKELDSWWRFEWALLARTLRSPFWASWRHALTATLLAALAGVVATTLPSLFHPVLLFILVLGGGYLITLLILLIRQPYHHARELGGNASGDAPRTPDAYETRAIRRIQDLSQQLQRLVPGLSVSSGGEQIREYRRLRDEIREEVLRLRGRYPAIENEADWLRRHCSPRHAPGEEITDEEMREWFTVPMSRSLEAIILACSDAVQGRSTASR